jgi:hypothetical protein
MKMMKITMMTMVLKKMKITRKMGALNIRYNKVYIKYINLLGNYYTVPSLFLIIILYLEARRYIIYTVYII